jgi:hypothetical protein
MAKTVVQRATVRNVELEFELEGSFFEKFAFPWVLEEQVVQATGAGVINVTTDMVRAKIDQMMQ